MGVRQPVYWWINNKADYKKNNILSYVWAPTKNKIGRDNPTWIRLREIRRDDIIIHYMGVLKIRAFSVADSDCYSFKDKDKLGNLVTG